MTAPSLFENGAVLPASPFELSLVEDALALAPLQAIEQEAAHFLCPAFLMFFGQEFQFAQVMLVAQGVQAVRVGEIGFPMVVDEPVLAPRQDAEVIHGLGAPLGMHAVEGERGIGWASSEDCRPLLRHGSSG